MQKGGPEALGKVWSRSEPHSSERGATFAHLQMGKERLGVGNLPERSHGGKPRTKIQILPVLERGDGEGKRERKAPKQHPTCQSQSPTFPVND